VRETATSWQSARSGGNVCHKSVKGRKSGAHDIDPVAAAPRGRFMRRQTGRRFRDGRPPWLPTPLIWTRNWLSWQRPASFVLAHGKEASDDKAFFQSLLKVQLVLSRVGCCHFARSLNPRSGYKREW
jgi:hypothetical protein